MQNDIIQHWLNGHLLLTAVVGSDEWKTRIANSKFHNVDGFGLNQTGKIMLTDHNSECRFRTFQAPTRPS